MQGTKKVIELALIKRAKFIFSASSKIWSKNNEFYLHMHGLKQKM